MFYVLKNNKGGGLSEMFRHNNPYPQWTALGMGVITSFGLCQWEVNLIAKWHPTWKNMDLQVPRSSRSTRLREISLRLVVLVGLAGHYSYNSFGWKTPVLQRIWHFHVTKGSKEKKKREQKAYGKFTESSSETQPFLVTFPECYIGKPAV